MKNKFEKGYRRKYHALVRELNSQGFDVNYRASVLEGYDIVKKSKEIVVEKHHQTAQEKYMHKSGSCQEKECNFSGNKVAFLKHRTITNHRHFSVKKQNQNKITEAKKNSTPFLEKILGGENN